MGLLYSTLKYLAVTLWSVFVIAPFLWAISTSFKDFQSVTNGATYIPWVDFEPTLLSLSLTVCLSQLRAARLASFWAPWPPMHCHGLPSKPAPFATVI